jgi:hypothetical protein
MKLSTKPASASNHIGSEPTHPSGPGYSHPFELRDDFFALCFIFAVFLRALSARSSPRTRSFCSSDASVFTARAAAPLTSSFSCAAASARRRREGERGDAPC